MAIKGDGLSLYGVPGISDTWTPGSIPSVKVFLFGDNLGADDDEIAQWADQSGNANHATQDTATKYPLVVADAIDGHKGVQFDGVNDFLTLPSDIGATPGEWEFYAIVDWTGADSGDKLFDSAGGRLILGQAVGAVKVYDSQAAFSGFGLLENFPDIALFNFRMTVAAGMELFLNGVNVDVVNGDGTFANTAISGNTALGASSAGASQWWSGGPLALFIASNGALSTADRDLMYAWIKGQFPSLNIAPYSTIAVISDSHDVDIDPHVADIVAFEEEMGIATVFHAGDLTNNSILDQGERNTIWAARGVSIATVATAGIPYFLTVGNHDHGASGEGERLLTDFTAAFPESLLDDQPEYVGSYDGGVENSYGFIKLNGVTCLVVVTEFGPRDAVVAWAETICDSYPSYRKIFLTHSFISGTDDARYDFDVEGETQEFNPRSSVYAAQFGSDVNDAQDMWDAFINATSNPWLVICGHDGNQPQTSTSADGSTVHQISNNLGDNIRFYQVFKNWNIRVRTYDPGADTFNAAATMDFWLLEA